MIRLPGSPPLLLCSGSTALGPSGSGASLCPGRARSSSWWCSVSALVPAAIGSPALLHLSGSPPLLLCSGSTALGPSGSGASLCPGRARSLSWWCSVSTLVPAAIGSPGGVPSLWLSVGTVFIIAAATLNASRPVLSRAVPYRAGGQCTLRFAGGQCTLRFAGGLRCAGGQCTLRCSGGCLSHKRANPASVWRPTPQCPVRGASSVSLLSVSARGASGVPLLSAPALGVAIFGVRVLG